MAGKGVPATRLDTEVVHATALRLRARIKARFPDRDLGRVAGELVVWSTWCANPAAVSAGRHGRAGLFARPGAAPAGRAGAEPGGGGTRRHNCSMPPAAAKTAAAKPEQPAKAAAPKAGAVQGGYRFKGGNPADKNNWEKV